MKVLLSIKPEYALKILSGEKKYEFRKAVFKDPAVRTVVIYATLPIGKVIGEFDVAGILSDRPDSLWRKTRDFSGITRKFFDQYFAERQTAHAIEVKEVRRYEQPLDLRAILPNSPPPQSFCYLA